MRVIKASIYIKSGNTYSLFECPVCESHFETRNHAVNSGKTKTCGCNKTKIIGSESHGSFKNMHSRCDNKENKDYKDYGARGIRVCERWSGQTGYAYFIKDIGHRTSKSHSIERLDVDGDYCKENCIWADNSKQASNRRAYGKVDKIGISMTANGKYCARVKQSGKILFQKTLDDLDMLVDLRDQFIIENNLSHKLNNPR